MSDIRHARRPLWLIAENFLSALFALFGSPEVIAARHTLVRKDWAMLASWLRAGEALLRRLLLIEAVQLEPAPPARPPRQSRPRVRRLLGFDAEAPKTWRVSFRCAGERQRERTSPSAARGARDASRFCSAWPLAERAEALLRAFNDPLPYARRLARRLRAAPHRAAALIAARPEHGPLVGEAGFAEVGAACETALAQFNTS